MNANYITFLNVKVLERANILMILNYIMIFEQCKECGIWSSIIMD